ncbi:MAG: YqaE/Pmp3 family membrane protein [Saprospiraceae bacterium]|nr:YqaE/Pmp3 family membrane protein [Saprospiraceae bacterium]MBL0260883.1 YqaE/Pmp3 family membrane protein [Saprospiraceae bacterium]
MKNFSNLLSLSALCLFVAVLAIGIPNESFAAYPGKKTVKTELQSASTTAGQTITVTDPNILYGKQSLPLEAQGGSDDKVLLIVLALLLPPLAVYMYYDEWNGQCWLNLILTLLCGIPGVIHALITVIK